MKYILLCFSYNGEVYIRNYTPFIGKTLHAGNRVYQDENQRGQNVLILCVHRHFLVVDMGSTVNSNPSWKITENHPVGCLGNNNNPQFAPFFGRCQRYTKNKSSKMSITVLGAAGEGKLQIPHINTVNTDFVAHCGKNTNALHTQTHPTYFL